jgi:hypothetical protein
MNCDRCKKEIHEDKDDWVYCLYCGLNLCLDCCGKVNNLGACEKCAAKLADGASGHGIKPQGDTLT